jgi:hypothetical protein
MSSVFGRAKFNLAVAAVGGTYVWEYWNGSAWTSLTVTDGTSGFTTNGVVTWTIPGTWATTAVNSVTQYWVRVRQTGTVTTLPTVNYLTVGGWTIAYSGTNVAAYRQGSGNGFFLRVDDSGTTSARLVGYETMSDVNTGTNAFPTNAQVSGGLYLMKSSTADATSRGWVMVCSDKLFHLFIDYDSNATANNRQGASFGDIQRNLSTDAFHTIIFAGTGAAASTVWAALSSTGSTSAGHYLCRSYTQIGGSAAAGKVADPGISNGSTTMGGGGQAYPDTVAGRLYQSPVRITEGTTLARGTLPGVWAPCHSKPLQDKDTFSGTGVLAGKSFIALNIYNASQVFIETSDTWDV